MSKYVIVGGQRLEGEVAIRGAKNASFKQIIASMLSESTTNLMNIPDISDVHLTQSIAKALGAQIVSTGPHSLEITTLKITSSVVPQGTGQASRSSFMFAAPLLVRTGSATIPLPGGDKLGARPLDRLFDCYRQMNIQVTESDKNIHLTTDGIKATTYEFPKPSHTVTEVILMTAALAQGQTIIKNAAREPEIDDLIDMLNSMGAQIVRDSANPSTITINGVPWLKGTNHQVIADRNEAVTFACAALASKGSVNILRIDPKIISCFIDTVTRMGAKVNVGRDEVVFSWVQPLKAVKVETEPEPGFMTDWQAIFSVLLTQAVGCSQVVERIFPSRFQHIALLQQMGAKANFFNPKIKDPATYYHFNSESDRPEYFHGVKLYGPTKLQPINVAITDLRAGACLTLAALLADGQSTLDNVELIERGYERLADRLCYLGAHIDYIKL